MVDNLREKLGLNRDIRERLGLNQSVSDKLKYAGKALQFGHSADGQYYYNFDLLKTHMHVIGLTGAGKSFFLELMMRQFLVAKKGFCLIDPLGYLYESMVNVVAHRPEFADRVIFFNPSKPTDYIAGYNPFQYDKSQGSLIAKRNTIAELLLQVFKTDPAIAQRLELVMRRAIHPLIEAGLTACELSYFFHDDAKIRNLILSRCSSAEVLDSWARIDQLPARMREEKLGSFENRVSKLTELEMIRATLGQTANTFSIPEVVEENKILLVNLSESEWLSGSDANVIGTMLVNDMHQYALRRSKEDAENNPFYLVMDEFHNFLTAKAENILDQCRQKGVHMILAHQRLNQLVSEHLNPKNAILEAVKSCARTKVIFSLYPDDADVFARYFAPELPEKEVKNEIYRTTVLNYSIEREIVHGRSRGRAKDLLDHPDQRVAPVVLLDQVLPVAILTMFHTVLIKMVTLWDIHLDSHTQMRNRSAK